MKLTKKRLKRIILEEVRRALKEADYNLGHGTTVDITRPSRSTVGRPMASLPATARAHGSRTRRRQPDPGRTRTEYGKTAVDVTRPEGQECQDQYDCAVASDRCHKGKCVDMFDMPLPAAEETGISKACKVKCAGKVFDILPGREEHAMFAYENFFRDPASKVENAKEWHALQACHKKCLGPSTADRVRAYTRKNPNADIEDLLDALGVA